MNREEFRALALRHSVDALEAHELIQYEKAVAELGVEAQEILREAALVPVALALSLEPVAPQPGRKKKILRAIGY